MQLIRGVIHTAANGDDEVTVLLETLVPGEPIGPCPYQLRGTTPPSAGDECLVAYDPAGSWVIAYQA